MIYMLILAIIVIGIYAIISYKQKAVVNGLTIIAVPLVLFNIIFPFIYEIYSKSELNYLYILIYYGVYFTFLSLGYYYFSKKNLFSIEIFKNLEEENIIKINKLILISIILVCLILSFLIPIDYLKNPRLLYEKTRLGFGPIYFGITTLINVYFIFSMFYKKKYYYIIFVIVILYFTGSKVRMLLPLELFFMYYFYVKSNNRMAIKKIVGFGIALIALFIVSYIVTSRYLPDRSINTIMRGLSSYSDYNRNFLILVQDLTKSKEYFWGQISFENNLFSLIPRAVFPSKPTIFGSFRISYKFYEEWTLLYQGAPSFGQFGALFADFGHLSLIIIAIYNFIIGAFLALSEKNFLKHKNPITFMLFMIFAGITFFDVGMGSIIVLIVNIAMVACLYYIIKYSGKYLDKISEFRIKKIK